LVDDGKSVIADLVAARCTLTGKHLAMDIGAGAPAVAGRAL
jgi:hypothetical protein